MTLPTNTLATYEQIGRREDLTDMIYRIDPTETPFMSGVDKAKASQTLHEWQTQALASAMSTNAQLEGDDANTDAVTVTVRRGNYCHVHRMPRAAKTGDALRGVGGRIRALRQDPRSRSRTPLRLDPADAHRAGAQHAGVRGDKQQDGRLLAADYCCAG